MVQLIIITPIVIWILGLYNKYLIDILINITIYYRNIKNAFLTVIAINISMIAIVLIIWLNNGLSVEKLIVVFDGDSDDQFKAYG